MEEPPKPIICDTNIWYYLGDGTIDPATVGGKLLVGTFVTAYEFGCTHNGYNKYLLFRSAVTAYKKLASKHIPEIPEEHIKAVSGQKSFSPYWGALNNALDVVVDHEQLPQREGTREHYLDFDATVEANRVPFNQLLADARSQIENWKEHRALMSTPASRSQHLDDVKSLLLKLTGCQSLDWDQLELFLKTFDEWTWQLATHPEMKMSSNDFHDIMMLAYVQPGSLYWTRDKVKTKRFIEEAGCGHYLYDPEKQT